MPNYLRDLHITRVDRVADPANEDARIVLFKSRTAKAGGPHQFTDDGNGMCATCGKTQAGGMHISKSTNPSPAWQEGASAMPVDKDSLDPEVATLIADLETKLADAEAKIPAEAPAEPTEVIAAADDAVLEEALKSRGFKVEKSEDPMSALPQEARDAIAKANTSAAEAIAKADKLEKAARRSSFIQKAKDEFAVLAEGEQAEVLGETLMKAADALGDDSDEFKAFMRTLTAANAAKGEADTILTKERGTARAGGAGSAMDQVAILAKSRVDADPKMSEQAATAAVLEGDPELYARYMQEREAAQRA